MESKYQMDGERPEFTFDHDTKRYVFGTDHGMLIVAEATFDAAVQTYMKELRMSEETALSHALFVPNWVTPRKVRGEVTLTSYYV